MEFYISIVFKISSATSFLLFVLPCPDDRHRVKLHSLLADPNSDYVNANYIDVRNNSSCLPTHTSPLTHIILVSPPLFYLLSLDASQQKQENNNSRDNKATT